ncbi:MAG: hypothetical protein DRG78_12155 [Epsilonproteobacteria bacterium]|nr:MAG: hypothetical protein DRG78_12155 [Campylobacterota bacterium]
MIISYNKKSGKGVSGAVEYVLENRDMNFVALLKGDAQITKDLIFTNTNKYKYSSGIIAFGNDTPTKEQVMDIIAEFEKSTFAGLEQEQYNILWVEHTDTSKYHLHFVIPRLELSTQKALNPNWHKADQDRLMLLQDYINNKYKFENPFQADKRQTLKIDKKQSNRDKTREHIHSIIEDNIIDGKITCRDDIVDFLNSNENIEVTRTTKKSMSILIDEQKIRFEGIYYEKTFRDISSISHQLQDTERKHTATTSEELSGLKQDLDRAISKKSEYNNEKYGKRTEEQQIDANRSNELSDFSNRTVSKSNNIKGARKDYDDEVRQGSDSKQGATKKDSNIGTMASAKRDKSYIKDEAIYQVQEKENNSQKGLFIHRNKRKIDENRTRHILREQANKKYGERVALYQHVRNTRTNLYEKIRRDSEQLSEQYREYYEKRRRKQLRDNEESNNHYQRVEQFRRRVKQAQSTATRFIRFRNRIGEYREKLSNIISNIRTYIVGIFSKKKPVEKKIEDISYKDTKEKISRFQEKNKNIIKTLG